MKSTSPRRAVFAALFLAPLLAACGFNAQTDQVYQPAEGVLDRSGSVDVLNALIVSGEDGSGTFVASLVNNDLAKADSLVSITGPGVTAPDEAIEIPADGAVDLAAEGKVALEGTGIKAGSFVELTLTFANGDAVTIKAPVVRHEGDYADVPVPGGGEATPSAEPTEDETESAH